MKIRLETSWVSWLVFLCAVWLGGTSLALADIDDLLEDDGLLGGEEEEPAQEPPPPKEEPKSKPPVDDEEDDEGEEEEEEAPPPAKKQVEEDEDEEEDEEEEEEPRRPSRYEEDDEEDEEDEEKEEPRRPSRDEDEEDEEEEEEEEEQPARRTPPPSGKRVGVELGIGFSNKLFVPALPKILFPEAKKPKTAGLPGDMYMPGAALTLGYDLGPYAKWPEFWLKFNTGFSFAGGDYMALYMLDLGLILEKKFEVSKDKFYWHLGLGPQFPVVIAEVGKIAKEKDGDKDLTGGTLFNVGLGVTTGPDVVMINTKGFAMHFRLALTFQQYFLPLEDFGGWQMTSDYKDGKRYYTKGWTASNLGITPGFNFIF